MQEHVFSAYESLQCTPVAYYGLDRQRFRNWNPFVEPADDAPRGARGVLRHVLLRDRQPLLPARRGEPCPHAAVGAQVRVRRPDGARHRRRGGRPAPDARLALEDVRERLGPRLEPGRLDPARDRPEGPPRDPAPDGGFLRDARERRRRRHALSRLGCRAAGREGIAAGRPPPLRTSPAAARPASTPARSTPCATGSISATHSASGTSSGVFANYAVPSRARRVPRRRSYRFPATLSTTSKTSPGGADGGRPTPRKLVVCALIENGGHGSTAAAPAALRVFERFFGVEAPLEVLRGHGLMIEVAAASADPCRRRSSRVRTARVHAPSRLGPARGGGRTDRVRPLGNRGNHALRRPGDESYFVVRQAIAAGIGLVGLVVATIVPSISRGELAAAVRRDARADVLRLPRRRDHPRLQALDRPRLHPVPAVRAREGPLRPRDRRLSRRARRSGDALADDPLGDRAGGRSHPARLPPAGPGHGPRLQRRSSHVLFFVGVRWRQLLVLRRYRRVRDPLGALAPARGGHPGSEAVPGGAPHARSGGGSERAHLQPEPVDHCRRLGWPHRPRRRPRPARRASTTSPSTRPTSPSPRSRSSVASSARRSCFCSICSSCGEGCGSSPSPSDLYGAVVAGGLVFAFVFQIFVNVGMTMGVAPVTGIPLPFVTVGGSSMVTNLAADRSSPGHPCARRARGRPLLEGRGRGGWRSRRASPARCRRRRHTLLSARRRVRHARGAARPRARRGRRAGAVVVERRRRASAGAEVVVRVLAGDPDDVDDAPRARGRPPSGRPVVFVQLWPQADWARALRPLAVRHRVPRRGGLSGACDRRDDRRGRRARPEALAARIPVLKSRSNRASCAPRSPALP